MFKKLLLCLTVAAAGSLSAADMKFSIPADGKGVLKYGDKLLLDGEYYQRCEGEYSHVVNTVPDKADSVIKNKSGNADIIIRGGSLEDGIVWCEEFVVSPKRAEITWKAIIPPGNYPMSQKMFRYVFSLPVKTLVGVPFEQQHGMHRHGVSTKTGVLTGKEPENTLIISHVRHLRFKGKMNLLIDFNPCGPWGVYQEDPTSSYKAHMVRKGDRYYFLMPFARAQWGGKASGKIVLIADSKPLNEVHPVDKAVYTYPWPTLNMVQFTPLKPVTGFKFNNYPGYYNEFKAWGKQKYSIENKMGWSKLGSAVMVKPSAKSSLGPIYSGGIAVKGEAVYEMDLPDSLVLVNCMLTGKGKVSCGDKTESFDHMDGSVTTVTIPVFIKNKKLNIKFEGQYRLSGIVVQLLMFENEDFLFSRGWWAAGKAPWKYKGFAHKDIWQKYYK